MKRRYLALFALISVVPLIVWLCRFGVLPVSTQANDWATFATYISGTIGVLVTLFGFMMIYLTYSKQVGDSYIASFESTLFRMIDYQRSILQNVSSAGKAQTGLPSLIYWATSFSQHFLSKVKDLPLSTEYHRVVAERLRTEYASSYQSNLYTMGNYFRHLYHVFKHIEEADLDLERKLKYAKLMRAQLSAEELFFIGVNGITVYGDKFRPLIEKYSLLHRLMNFDFYRALFVTCYSRGAFGDEDLGKTLPMGNNSQEKWYSLLKRDHDGKVVSPGSA